MMWLIAQLNLFQFVNIQIKRTLQGNLLFMMAILNFDDRDLCCIHDNNDEKWKRMMMMKKRNEWWWQIEQHRRQLTLAVFSGMRRGPRRIFRGFHPTHRFRLKFLTKLSFPVFTQGFSAVFIQAGFSRGGSGIISIFGQKHPVIKL